MRLILLTEARAMTYEEWKECFEAHRDMLRDLGMTKDAAISFMVNAMNLGIAEYERPVLSEDELIK